jgi:hypothetical protein
LAGFCAGWALASEYSSGLVFVGLLIYVFFDHGWPKTRVFVLSAVPPLLLIPLYSWLSMGSPFELPYSRQASFPAMREGLYAIKWPDLQTTFHLLFSPERGLFFWSPFYFLALLGYPELIHRAPRLFLLTYAAPVLQVVVISGRVWDWPAGPTYGPRLLTPMLPLLAIPCALGLKRCPLLGIPLVLYSVAVTTLATLTDAFPHFAAHPNPLLDLQIPLLIKGKVSPTLATELGMNGYFSSVLFWAVLVGGVSWLLLKERSRGLTIQVLAEPADR